jgi:Spy/CpxP family protein refolding chaperone
MKNWIYILSGTTAVSLAVAAWAEPGFGRGAGGRQGPPRQGPDVERILDNPRAARDLGLTEEQLHQIREARYEAEKKIIAQRAEHDLARLEVRRLLQQNSPDEAAVLKAVEEEGRLATELKKLRIQQRFSMTSIVGPEKFRELRGRWQDRPGDGRGFGPGSGGSPDGDRPRFERRNRRESSGQDGSPPWMRNRMPPPEEDELE